MSIDQQSHSAVTIAKYILWKSKQQNISVTNKKLQKLLYYSQAWHLVFREGKPLFEEDLEAWIHGPAVRNVYQEYKSFGFNPITIELTEVEAKDGLSEDEIEVLDSVLEVYGGYDPQYLEVLTHREAPWISARNNIPEYQASTAVITLESMKDYYGRKIAEIEASENSEEAGQEA